MDLSPDTLLRDRYRIIRSLGKGGMGAVYLAYDTSLEMEVAVKCNHKPGEESTSQFLREARILAALRHPHLPRVIDYFIDGQDQYLVMDFVPGETLEDILQREGAQPLDRVLTWAQQLGEALTYLHDQVPPVTHRDIKPANIKITPDGQVMLVDFGIAKIADTAQMTATGARGYTTGYAPPEQYGGARTGPFSDQYALAATLYKLLTDQKPTDGVQRALGEAVLTPLNLLNPDIPVHVQGAIEKAMSPRIQERYDSVAAFLHALADPLFKPAQPRLASLPRAAEPTPTTPTQPPPGAGKRKGWIWVLAALGGLALIAALLTGAFFLLRGPGGANPLTAALPSPTASLPVAVAAPSDTPAPPPTPTLTSLPPTDAPSPVPPSPTPEPQLLGGGGWVAFSSDRGQDGTLQIWLMRLTLQDGLVQADQFTQLTFGPGDKTQPAWSPDGTKLLFVAPANENSKETDIWLLDRSVDGKQPLNISLRKGSDSDPAWSPDGNWIAFTNQNQAGVRQMFVMNPAGTDQRKVSESYTEYAPQWSPDSKKLLFIRDASSHTYLFEREWVTEELPFPTPYPTPYAYDRSTFFGRLGQVGDFTWSRDGALLAYTETKGRIERIYVLPYAGRGADLTLLTQDTTLSRQPAFSPDQQWLVFTSEMEPGKPGLSLMTINGLLRTDLTDHTGIDQQAAWQPLLP